MFVRYSPELVWADSLDATQQNISRHLALLYESGVVGRRQIGRQVWYRLADEDAMALLDDVGAQLVNRFRRFSSPDDGERFDRAAG